MIYVAKGHIFPRNGTGPSRSKGTPETPHSQGTGLVRPRGLMNQTQDGVMGIYMFVDAKKRPEDLMNSHNLTQRSKSREQSTFMYQEEQTEA